MKKAQLENGYTRIANELLEALSSQPLSGYEMRVVLAIIRKTYGYGKKEDRIALSQLSEVTKIGKSHVSRTVTSLISYGIVTKLGNGVTNLGNTLAINKDFSAWKVTKLGNTKKALNVLPKMVKGVTKLGKKSLPKSAPQKKKETITKERVTLNNFLSGFLSSWNELYGTKFHNTSPLEENASHWLKQYSEAEILEAVTRLQFHDFWNGKMTPTIFLRKKNPRGEHVDYIGELLNTKKKSGFSEEYKVYQP